MAVRNEAVRLSLQDAGFTTGMAKAAAATGLLDRSLNDLDGSNVRVRTSTPGVAREIDGLGRSSRNADHSINQLTGRIRLMIDAATVLGPALVPLGAGATSVLAGATAQMGALAGAVGVGALAFTGLGDGLGALNDYQLEPTVANMEKLQQELERLGPAGANFMAYLDSIGPQLKTLQAAAREGLFPGAEEGIESLLERLPQVRRIVREIATGMGDLAAGAGEGLAGSGFDDFFDYLDREAVPLLTEFAQTLGNFVEGFANMMVAFSPLSSDFSAGLLDMSDAFVRWSQGLESSETFQDFIDYVQRSGPAAVDFLGSLTDALVQLVTAAAPIGEVTLPMLTNLLDAFAGIAGSDIGAPLLAGAVAMTAFNRASKGFFAAQRSGFIVNNYTKPMQAMGATAPAIGQVGTYFARMGQSAEHASKKTMAARESVRGFVRAAAPLGKSAALLGGIGIAATGAADGFGLTNTASMALMGTMFGPWGTAIGGATGALLDMRAAGADTADELRDLNDAMAGDNAEKLRREIADVRDEMADIVEVSRGEGLGGVKDLVWGALSTRLSSLGKAADEAEEKLSDLDRSANRHGLSSLLGTPLNLASEFDMATNSIEEFGQSFADLNSMLDRSGSLINYEEALDSLAASMGENGSFNVGIAEGRENLSNLNEVVARAIERSEALKVAGDDLGAVRILRRARADLEDFGAKSDAAKKKTQPLIAELDRLAGKKVKPEIDAETSGATRKTNKLLLQMVALNKMQVGIPLDVKEQKALEGIADVKGGLNDLDGSSASPGVGLDAGGFFGVIGTVRSALDALNGKTAVTFVETRRIGTVGGMGPRVDSAEGNIFAAYANGDYADQHKPEITRRGVTRVWNEPETKGESYIPHADDHRRPRAKSILEQTASLFGGEVQWYAEGGSDDDEKLTKAQRRTRAYHRDVRQAERGFKLSGLDTRETRQELREFTKAIREAGGHVDKSFDRLSKRSLHLAGRFDGASKRFDAAKQRAGDLRTGGADSFNNDPFGNGLAGFDLQIGADSNDAAGMAKTLRKLKRRGLNGPLYDALAVSGDINTAQQLLSSGRGGIRSREQAFERRDALQTGLGNQAAVYAAKAQDRASKAMDRLTKEVRGLERKLEAATERGTRKGSQAGIEGRDRRKDRDTTQRGKAGR